MNRPQRRLIVGWAVVLLTLIAAGPARAAPGDVVSASPAVFAGEPLLRVPIPGVQATHVLYRSTDVRGDPNVVSGTILVPTAAYPGKRPIIGYGVGTHGLGDQCAPSYEMSQGTETESELLMGLLNQGWAVAVTDYEGLGTPGQHTYAVGPSLGHAVLDAIRAASRVPSTGLAADAPVGIWGYSEGGAAAAWAAQLQPTYAPELRLVGAAAGGVPADVAAVARNLDGSGFFGFGAAALMGLDAAFPALDLRQYLNAAGDQIFTAHADDCLLQLLLPPFTLSRYAAITTTDVLDRPDVQAAFAQSKLGLTAPLAPLLLYHGQLDEVIPYSIGLGLRDRYCAQGVTTEWQPYPLAEHITGSLEAAPFVISWLRGRFAGQPTPNNCPVGGFFSSRTAAQPRRAAHRRTRRHVAHRVRPAHASRAPSHPART